MALSLTPSAALELWPRLAASARLECRHRAELLEQAKHVNQRPVLNDLPRRVETIDVDQLEGGLPAGRGQARELAVMRSGASHPAHGLITLGDLVSNDSPEVGKGSANLGDKLPHALAARSGPRARDVVNDVGGDKLGDWASSSYPRLAMLQAMLRCSAHQSPTEYR
jgi:hypothetical protein